MPWTLFMERAEISRSRLAKIWIIPKLAYALVAGIAKKGSDFAGLVTMIYMHGPFRNAATYSAASFLFFLHHFKVFYRKTVNSKLGPTSMIFQLFRIFFKPRSIYNPIGRSAFFAIKGNSERCVSINSKIGNWTNFATQSAKFSIRENNSSVRRLPFFDIFFVVLPSAIFAVRSKTILLLTVFLKFTDWLINFATSAHLCLHFQIPRP